MQINDALDVVSVACRVLILRDIAGDQDTWDERVLRRLTYAQRSRVSRTSDPSMVGHLDLASLLRVIDQNWMELVHQVAVTTDDRTYVRETMGIRNRVAHRNAEEELVEDQYRDFDTIARLLVALRASEETVTLVTGARDALLQRPVPQTTTVLSPAVEGLLSSGVMVRLLADPAVVGVIMKVRLEGDAVSLDVFGPDGKMCMWFAAQIEVVPVDSSPQVASVNQMRSALTAFQLKHPSSRYLYSLFSSRIDFVPYQFRPVMRLLSADRPRLLIADEVGVGKTIEAGLILKELQARRDISNVLIICPKPLVTERKWLDEMKRFDETFVHLDGDTLRSCIDESHLDGQWPVQFARSIIPYSLLD